MQEVNALIFDLDNTLALTQDLHYLAFREVFARRGLNFTRADDARYAGKGSSCIFPEFAKENGRSLSEEELTGMAKEKAEIYDRLLHSSEIREVPGAQAFVEKMFNAGIKIGVASGNKLPAIEYILGKIGLSEEVVAVMVNKYVLHAKPEPDIFLAAAKRLGVPPEECIVFEDATNGVIAAKKGGFRVIALTTTFDEKTLREAGADEVVGDFTELDGAMLTRLSSTSDE